MSDTRRHVDKAQGWCPGHKEFDEWNQDMARRNRRKPIMSAKHQERDRHNRQRKHDPYRRSVHGRIDTMREQESREDADEV